MRGGKGERRGERGDMRERKGGHEGKEGENLGKGPTQAVVGTAVGSVVEGSGVVGTEAGGEAEMPERPEAVMDTSRFPRTVPVAAPAAAAGSVGGTEAAGSMSKARHASIGCLLSFQYNEKRGQCRGTCGERHASTCMRRYLAFALAPV